MGTAIPRCAGVPFQERAVNIDELNLAVEVADSGTHLAPRPRVDARERWQALQTNLNVARASLEAGDRTRALEAVNAALAIDPEFLAAQSLRDRILTWTDLPVAAPSPLPLPAPIAAPARQVSTARRPLVSAEGYARFEERAKRRRVDKRIEAARLAIERHKLRDAAAALDEVIELDPNSPELASLTTAFDELRRSTVRLRPRAVDCSGGCIRHDRPGSVVDPGVAPAPVAIAHRGRSARRDQYAGADRRRAVRTGCRRGSASCDDWRAIH